MDNHNLYKIAENWENASTLEKKYLMEKVYTVLPKMYHDGKEIYVNKYINKTKENEYTFEFWGECHVLIDKDSQLHFVQWPCECGPDGCDGCDDDMSFGMFD